MATGRKIKGITIEIGGETTGLDKALSDVNQKIKNTQSGLKDVERLLKLDPTNTVLVAQKQEMLKEAISESTKKLEQLEAAQNDVTTALQSGKIGQEEYRAFQREIEATKASITRYTTELDNLNKDQERLSTNTERLKKLFEATGTDVDDYADVLGSRLVTAIKNGSASSDQLKTALEKVAKSAAGGKVDIQELTDALDTVDDGQAVSNLISGLRNVGDEADDTAEQLEGISEQLQRIERHADDTSGQLEEMNQTLTGGAMMQAAEQLQAVGEKIKELGEKASETFLEFDDATVKATTYFGETGKAAEQTTNVIKKVYADGVGESMDSVADAVIAVKKNLQNLDETTLTNITEQALTLDSLYGIDMNETLRGVNSLMSNFGMTAQEALDYIVAGTQNGLDKTDELGDNLAEYAGKFSQAGYSAQEYFQLLQNGLNGGAYNLDKVNDAINEVTTRLADGTIADALGSYSGKTQDVFKAWQEGKATQKDVIDSIVEDITNCQNQQEQLNMAATAFGTMAEDGSMKFITSISTVGDTYNDVSDAAKNMFDNSTTDSQMFEASMRQLQQSLIPLGEQLMRLANEIIPPIASGLKTVGDFFAKLPEPVQNFAVILGALIAVFTAVAPTIAAVAFAVKTLSVPLLPIIGIIAGVAVAITGIIAIVKNWGTITEWFGDLWTKVKEKCSQAWKSICTFFTETIPQAWDSLVSKFEGVQEWWFGIWQQVGDFFSQIWEKICSLFTETIPQAWQSVVSWLEGIPEWWFGIWQQVGDFFSQIWEKICSLFTETIPQAWQSVVSWLEGIPEWWSGIWQQVGDFFSEIWQSMKEIPVLSEIVTMLENLWNNFTTGLENIWNGIVQTAQSIWTIIKNVILAPVLLLIDLVLGDFTQLKSDAENIWSGIAFAVQAFAQTLVNGVVGFITGLRDILPELWTLIKEQAIESWNSLKDSVVEAALNLKDSAVQKVNELKDSAKETWQNLKESTAQAWHDLKESAVQSALNLKESAIQKWQELKTSTKDTWENMKTSTKESWQNLKESVVSKSKNMKEEAVQGFRDMKEGIKNTLSGLRDTVENGFQSAIEFITSLPERAMQWGADFIDGIVSGIRNTIGKVRDAVSDVADTIRSFLHFSVPDEGPLTEYESWMPDFMQGLAEGIKKSKSVVTDAIKDVSKDMTINANAMVQNAGNSDLMNIGKLLMHYLPLLEQGTVLQWETGEVAAHLAPAMNQELGILAVEEGRL